MNIRVLVIEDHPLMQKALEGAISADPGMEVVGVAGDGSAGLELALERRPDVVVLDLGLPGLGGVRVLERLRDELPEARCLVVTATEEAGALLNSVAAGAAGYLTKRATGEEIRNAVVTVKAGGSVISPILAGHLLSEYSQASREPAGPSPLLTRREQEILRHVADGATDREIAERLHLSVRTVQNHLANVRGKTGLRRRAQLARWAGGQGW